MGNLSPMRSGMLPSENAIAQFTASLCTKPDTMSAPTQTPAVVRPQPASVTGPQAGAQEAGWEKMITQVLKSVAMFFALQMGEGERPAWKTQRANLE